jgi:DNA-binding MarR family transcriptional regulator/N-acetylglutamate synthase-like GNAT family acetyltransferase
MPPTPVPPDRSAADLDRRIDAIRAFNRFYTRRIGVVREDLLQSRFSLTEARVIYELAQSPGLTATDIGSRLDLDAGYLSRMLARFEQEGMLTRAPALADRRQALLSLTEAGRAEFEELDSRSRAQTGALLAALPAPEQEALVDAMGRIAATLRDCPAGAVALRQPNPGDIGWVVSRHGALYAEEYGFDHRFEALVATVAGDFLRSHDPARERCWIADRDGVRLGSVFLVRETDEVARLRLLLVEPGARGIGLGRRLVRECLTVARAGGYRRVTLWTNDVLVAARAIYRAEGFQLVASEPHSSFGPAMVGEDWELDFGHG